MRLSVVARNYFRLSGFFFGSGWSGQPSAGRSFLSASPTAFFQGLLSLTRSGSGPLLRFGFFWFVIRSLRFDKFLHIFKHEVKPPLKAFGAP